MGLAQRVLWRWFGSRGATPAQVPASVVQLYLRRPDVASIDVLERSPTRGLKPIIPQPRAASVRIPDLRELKPPPIRRARVPIDLPSPAPVFEEVQTRVARLDFELALPAVHGRVFPLEAAKETDEPAEPLAVPPTIERPPPDQAAVEEPYIPEELYALLLPPAADLVGITFEWPADLYPFQIEGVKFLTRRRHALLADDMGLGKTIEAIAAIRILLKAGWLRKILVVCPASVRTNWVAEFRRWAPEIQCELIEGDPEERKWCWTYPCHVLVTNYRSLLKDYEYGFCNDRRFDLVILDEAQKIKNPGTKTSQTAKALSRGSSWCLTGTPVENSADDLRSIFDFIHPDLNLADCFNHELRDRIEPYFLRRRKEEVLDELPPKQINNRWLSLSPAQRQAYIDAETQGIAYLRELGHEITITHVLQLITKLKQICNFDPRTGDSCKVEYMKDVLDEIAEAGEKALVFSQFVKTLEYVRAELGEHSPLFYHGGLSARERDEVVADFMESPDRPLMLVSLKAGGLGLNLQAASWVFHYDRWWTPAAERQAEDRAHRIGQTRQLMVERLMCENTIEERIHAIQERKRRLFEELVEGDYEDGYERLTEGEIFEAVGLEPELARLARESRAQHPGTAGG